MVNLEEKKVLAAVTYSAESNSFEVRWLNKILRDGEVISSIPHRASYSIEQRAEFLAEVQGAEDYLIVAGW